MLFFYSNSFLKVSFLKRGVIMKKIYKLFTKLFFVMTIIFSSQTIAITIDDILFDWYKRKLSE